VLPFRLHAWAARRLADPAFQRWATRFPLTRPVARRRALELFSLSTGFVRSQLLAVGLRSGLLDALRDDSATLSELAERLNLEPSRLSRLVDASVPLGLLMRSGQDIALGRVGAAVLGNPAARAMIEHHDALYRDLAEAESLLGKSSVRAARPPSDVADLWGYAGAARPELLERGRVASYSHLMTRSQALLADEILSAVPLTSRRRLLDVGGGEGAFAAAALQRCAWLRAGVFDLPAVCAAARHYLDDQGVGARACVYPGSFLTDALPQGADVISLVRVIHDHDDGPALALLRAAHAALPPGGLLVIAEPMAGVEPVLDAYFATYFLSMGQGRLRTAAELRQLLREAGWERIRQARVRLPLLTGVLTAQVPMGVQD
jgi:demethylspheroidene O-methyltransferase